MNQYSFSSFAAWGLTVAIGFLTIFGIYAAFLTPDEGLAAFLHVATVTSFAAAAVFALFLANCAASHAHAMLRAYGARSASFAFAAICAAGFCAASVIGVHLGYGTLEELAANKALLPDKMLVTAGALFLAFAKPAMSWVVEARKSADEIASEAVRQRRRNEYRADDARLAAAVTPTPAPETAPATPVQITAPTGPRLIVAEPAAPERKTGATAVMGALLFATTGGVISPASYEEPAPRVVVEQLVEQIQYDAVNTDAFRHVVALRVAKATNVQIMAETGLARTTVHRWLAVIDRAIADVRAARMVA